MFNLAQYNATSYEVLNDLTKLNTMLASKGLSLPLNWQQMSVQSKQQFLDSVMTDTKQTEEVAQQVNQFATDQKDNMEEMQNVGVNMQSPAPAVMAKKKPSVFNLKKAQLEPPAAAPSPPPTGPASPPGMPTDPTVNPPAQQPGQPQSCPEQFADAGQLQQCLASFQSANDAIKFVGEKYTNANQSVSDPNNPQRTDEAFAVIKEALNDFFSTQDPSVKNKAASTIFDMILPTSAKSQNNDPNAISSQEQTAQPGAVAMVKDTNEIIKRLAKEYVKKAKPIFNLKKEAQHQSIHNVMLFGPAQNKIDAFTGMQINDWHLVERNKGFGLKIDDVLDVDFEAIWRGSVMDKYNRPYKDKQGNWVGGYIESRFEVDKNIPPMNNLQLGVGERRRPIVPEHGITESRMEAARSKLNTDRGYEPSSKGEPFNWKKAQAEKKSKSSEEMNYHPCGICKKNVPCTCEPKTAVYNASKENKKKVNAQLEAPRNEEMMMPGEQVNTALQPKPVCKICGGDIAKAGGESRHKGICVNCEARMPSPNMVAPGQQTPAQQPMMLQKTQSQDGIYFDSRQFIVYAQGQRNVFDKFEEAEAFNKQQPVEEDQLPDALHPVKSKLKPRQREIFDAADRLHIDG